jgi:magnesium chelatase subunit D
VSAPRFPLSAIVGQEQLVQALLINAVAPDVGGVLIRGERGTAKSTAVRALAPLLEAVGERGAPLVEVPLGATLDRLLGSLDLRRALDGEHRFEPGLLARADGGILYVDEVNLLPDHLVDALLDAAASGVVRVEREAVSVEHEARFVLVGTMNVEEGELRPQLLDRFGLGVEVRGPEDPAVRAEIVRRRLAFERNPEAFVASFAPHERALADRIAAARGRLARVRLDERELLRITSACARLGVDGVRGDIVWSRAAVALAALDGAEQVEEAHLRAAASLALLHRRRRDPLGGQDGGAEELERALAEDDEQPRPDPSRGGGSPPPSGADAPLPPGAYTPPPPHSASSQPPPSTATSPPPPASANGSSPPSGAAGERSGGQVPPAADGAGLARAAARPRRDAPAPAQLPPRILSLARAGRGPQGRRARSAGPGAGSIDSRPAGPEAADIAVVATLRARLLEGQLPPRGAAGSLREHIRAGRESALLCVIVDASGSMGARRRLARVKGALLELLRDAYARRDRVAIIAFARDGARLLAAPGAPIERAAAAVRELPTGGRTPLAAGLDLAATVIRREAAREPRRRALAVLLTDGRVADQRGEARAAAARLGRAAAAVHVIDTEEGPVRLGLACALAAAAGGSHHQLRSAA